MFNVFTRLEKKLYTVHELLHGSNQGKQAGTRCTCMLFHSTFLLTCRQSWARLLGQMQLTLKQQPTAVLALYIHSMGKQPALCQQELPPHRCPHPHPHRCHLHLTARSPNRLHHHRPHHLLLQAKCQAFQSCLNTHLELQSLRQHQQRRHLYLEAELLQHHHRRHHHHHHHLLLGAQI